ncbi:MAG: hypothetical protein QXH91_07280, partial [Candidatus Bathyarchaeia archaeon]
MILIINVCSDKLSELEFVKPIEVILRNFNIKFLRRHFLDITQRDLDKTEKIIICGTALKDTEYLENIDRFSWLKDYPRSILGICAGFKILAKIFGNDLIEKAMIGQFKVDVIKENKLTTEKEFYSYFLSSDVAKIIKGFEILAMSENGECMIKH